MFKSIFFKALDYYLKNQFKLVRNPVTRAVAKRFRTFAIRKYGPQLEILEKSARQKIIATTPPEFKQHVNKVINYYDKVIHPGNPQVSEVRSSNGEKKLFTITKNFPQKQNVGAFQKIYRRLRMIAYATTGVVLLLVAKWYFQYRDQKKEISSMKKVE